MEREPPTSRRSSASGGDDSICFPDDETDECPNCGGEGVIYMCQTEYACVDPEGGCDLCECRCDWCRPIKNRSKTNA